MKIQQQNVKQEDNRFYLTCVLSFKLNVYESTYSTPNTIIIADGADVVIAFVVTVTIVMLYRQFNSLFSAIDVDLVVYIDVHA